MITTRVHIAIASARSWVTNITVMPASLQSFRKSSSINVLVCASKGPNGSSISSMFGPVESTDASCSLFLIPPDS